MKHKLLFAISLQLYLICRVSGFGIENIDVEENEDGNGFEVLYRNISVLRHTSAIPLMAIGHGTFSAPEVHGNFNITDVMDEKIELENCNISNLQCEFS